MEEKNEVVVAEQPIVMPAVSTKDGVAAFRQFEEIKANVLTEVDKQPINNKPYIRKTGWRKIKTLFNLKEEILLRECEDYEITGAKHKRWIYRVRVSAKNGAFADAEMCCDTQEPFSRNKPMSAVMAMAQTRAFNRAISDLVGGGEVSAEEMMGCDDASKQEASLEIPKEPKCWACGNIITPKVYSYSVKKYSKPLCMQHQKEVGMAKDAEVVD